MVKQCRVIQQTCLHYTYEYNGAGVVISEYCEHRNNKSSEEGNCTYDSCPLPQYTKVKVKTDKERLESKLKSLTEYYGDGGSFEQMEGRLETLANLVVRLATLLVDKKEVTEEEILKRFDDVRY